MDWAVLYMRLFAGGMMFFHNIGKIQDYNEIVNSYPSFAFAGSPAVFVIVSLVEVVLATLIIMGLWVRASAIVMAAGILGVLLWGAPGFGTLAFTWLGVYVFLGMWRGALCVRHGPFPCETKKLNEENNIRSPAGRYVGGNIVTLSRFVFI